MDNRRCPICEIDLSISLPSFCTQCGWDLKHDITLVPSLHEIPENILERYKGQVAIARRNWKERLEAIDRQKELEGKNERLRAERKALEEQKEKERLEAIKRQRELEEEIERLRAERNALEGQKEQERLEAIKRQKGLEGEIDRLRAERKAGEGQKESEEKRKVQEKTERSIKKLVRPLIIGVIILQGVIIGSFCMKDFIKSRVYYIEREDYDQQKGKISLETDRITSTIAQNIAKASGISVNDTLSVTGMPGRIKAVEGYVDGIWLEHHGFGGIRVKIKLDHMSQRWVMYHLDGSPVRDFEYVAATGNIGGAQTKDTIKVYAVAFAKDSGCYAILVCPDVEASPVVNGMREINLNSFVTNLIEGAAASILGNPPFNLRNETIDRLFAPTAQKGGGQ